MLNLVQSIARPGESPATIDGAWRQGAAPALAASCRIDPFSLRLFVSVIDTGTIAAAAEREHIAPSAVSKRLSDLEYSVRTRLLERSNRGIEPTPAGLELLGLARNVLNELDNVVHRMRVHAEGERGTVRVLASLSAITEFMPDTLRAFAVRCPQVRVELQERVSSAVLQGIAANAAEVGVYAQGAAEAHVGGLVSLPWRQDELVLVLPPGHPLSVRDAVGIEQAFDHDFVGLHAASHINQELMRAAQSLGRGFSCRMQVTGYDALSAMVAAGMGLAVMPRAIARRYQRIDGLHVLPLAERWARREIRVCVRSVEALSPPARLFVEHLRGESNG